MPRLFHFQILRVAAVLCLAGTLVVPPAGFAQAPQGSAAEALNRDGDAYFDRRQYKEAIAAYGKLIQGYPNSELVTDARFHAAYAEYFTGQFGPAADDLRKLTGSPTTPAEVLEQASLLLPQVLSQEASAMKPEDPARRAGFEAAIREFDGFVEKFPKSTDLETALYGRAAANYQAANYPAAAKDLRQNVAGFPNSDTVLDSTFLLALTVATEANLALDQENRAQAETDAALKGYGEAERLLG